jgi:tRNA(fMet)-specific endonuclease VapC
MPRFMLDTNICIYLMKNQPPEVAQRFAECFVGDVVISAITLAELEYGVACSGKQKAVNQSALRPRAFSNERETK